MFVYRLRKNLVFLYLFIFLLGTTSLGLALAQENDGDRDEELVMLTFPFQQKGETEAFGWLSEALLSMIDRDLSALDEVQLIDRSEVQRLEEEMKLAELEKVLEVIDKSVRKKIGVMIGADIALLGSFEVEGEQQLSITVKVFNLKLGELTRQEEASGKIGDLFKLENQLVFKVLDSLFIRPDAEEQKLIGDIETDSLEAAFHLYQGINYIDQAIELYHGKNYPDQKLWASAIKHCSKAIDIDPNYALAHYYLATIYERTGWYGRETGAWDMYLDLAPNGRWAEKAREKSIEDHLSQGKALFSAGKYEAAIREFIRVLKRDPDSFGAHYWLAKIYERTGESEKALREWNRVLDLRPDNAEAKKFVGIHEMEKLYGKEAYDHYQAGVKFYEAGDYKKAGEELEKAVEGNPIFFLEAHKYLRDAYYATERFNEYRAEQLWIIDASDLDRKQSALEYLSLGLKLRAGGQMELALREFKRASDFDPQLIEARLAIAMVHSEMGELRSALEECQRILILSPNFKEARELLTQVRYKIGAKLEEIEATKGIGEEEVAIKEEREVIPSAKSPPPEKKDDFYSHYKRGYNLYIRGRYQEAIEELDKALKIKPSSAQAYEYLARTYQKLGDVDKYIEMKRSAIDFSDRDRGEVALAHYKFGYEMYSQGNKLVALDEFQMATQLDPALAQAHYWLGRIYYEGGNYEMAKAKLEETLRLSPGHKGAAYLLERMRE